MQCIYPETSPIKKEKCLQELLENTICCMDSHIFKCFVTLSAKNNDIQCLNLYLDKKEVQKEHTKKNSSKSSANDVPGQIFI